MAVKKGLHVGIVMDGNRRYATKKLMTPKLGHHDGAKALENLLESFNKDDLGISEMTFYAFSSENFDRTDDEKDELFKLFLDMVKRLDKNKKIREKTNITFLGRLNLFPPELYNEMKRVMAENKPENEYSLNFLMAYNGQDEIVDAFKNILESGENNITRETVKKHLYLNKSNEADIIIRTGMEDGARLSGFMLWDSSYAELYFLNIYWPEFNYDKLKEIIEDYKTTRHRRFGK